MRKYIVDLTNSLIRQGNFDEMWIRLRRDPEKFIGHVATDLAAGDVGIMTPETLGRIMCNLELGDVGVGHLGQEAHFSGDCGDFLREIVSIALAYVIRDRLDESHPNPNNPPPYMTTRRRYTATQLQRVRDHLNQTAPTE